MVWAAFFNFVAAFGFGIQRGEHHRQRASVDLLKVVGHRAWCIVIFAALSAPSSGTCSPGGGACPSSSSHALIGGLVGAALAKAGSAALVGAGIGKIALFIVLSPLIGLVLGSFTHGRDHLDRAQAHARAGGQVVPARCRSSPPASTRLGHGANDAQKTMGIIAVC